MSQRRPEPRSDSSQEEAGMKGGMKRVKEWAGERAGAPIKVAGFRLERGEVVVVRWWWW